MASTSNSAPFGVASLYASYIIIFPVPFGIISIALLEPPVSSFKTPFPFVLIVTGSSFEPPILTVSVSKFTSPVPFGATVISLLAPLVIVIEPVLVFPVCKVTS